MQQLFGIIASVLHLGNIKFEANERGYASLNNNNQEMNWVSKVSPKQSSFSLNPSSLFILMNDTRDSGLPVFLFLNLLCSCWGFLLRCYNRA